MPWEELFHIKHQLGAVPIEVNGKTKIQFRMFFPAGFDTKIDKIRVAGTFQTSISETNWDFSKNHLLTKTASLEEGELWTFVLDDVLEDGFYEYRYQVSFQGTNETREIADPYARYSGRTFPNSGFVVGGTHPVVRELADRKPLRDLVIYELHIGDFTEEFRGSRAPFDAIRDKLQYLQDLGINAIEFMPWTAWKTKDYDWGYAPFQYFAVEYSYANDEDKPAEKISYLKELISECHDRGIHVMMDGVYNHVDPLFPYKDFYLDRSKCPYTDKDFGGAFPGLQDLDFEHPCCQAFIRDVCLYWISEYKIDGIRFDNTVNFYVPGTLQGLPDLLESIQSYATANGLKNFSMTLEHLAGDTNAADVVNTTEATSFWDDELYGECFDQLRYGGISGNYLATLNHIKMVNGDKTPTLYLSNHDHSSASFQAGSWSANRTPDGAHDWYRTQPHVIAMLTSPGAILIPMGQEFAADFYLPESDDGNRRVLSRPLQWKEVEDNDDHTKWGPKCFGLYQKLLNIRKEHPALRSRNFYPPDWQGWMTELDKDGIGVDTSRNLMVYHRWGQSSDGQHLERFYVVLNFSTTDQTVTVNFAEDGKWQDLLAGTTVNVVHNRLTVTVERFWGHVFFKSS
ncbi:hypothetical protein H2200_001836 [Cladophialophora chaetospira]|uniref:Glycosyl hydrolase family 13 catalytic domain-containing protein n=1 Tax=Cladophialophora chaetospira TaxID=386627 RepID=A0AA39CPG2_9EURO|nr:hypothetical protein H2200_001836 [Cladophialophora chaetospira]